MKFIISIILIALLSLAAGLFFPWWIVAITAFIVTAVIPQKPYMAFLSGFIALFMLWSILAWWLSNNNGHLLAHKVSMLILKINSPFLLILVTALIGSLVAGFASLAGSYLRKN